LPDIFAVTGKKEKKNREDYFDTVCVSFEAG
jgi:hypothetical protein